MILALAANPSIDKLFEIERLVRGDIHRPLGFVQTAGGKGLNLARAATALGAEVTAVALLRGHTGRWLAEQLSAEGVTTVEVWTHGENRASLSVADRETRGLTEFYEHGSRGALLGLGRSGTRRRLLVGVGRLAHHQRLDAAGRSR